MPSDENARWDPIEGVDLPGYARACALLLKHDPADAVAVLGTVGLTVASWTVVRAAWGTRIERYDDVRAAYVATYRAETT